MEPVRLRSYGFCVEFVCCLCLAVPAFGQQLANGPEIPPHFKRDLETAARLRPQLMAQSVAATGRYAIGHLVLNRLIRQIPRSSATPPARELRIVPDDQFNAYASPDGTLYVDSDLAQLAGGSAGLWAAILSHEIAHVVRRDWARRFLYQKSLENSSAGDITLDDPGLSAASWADSRGASENLACFCRQMELDADREGLMLMAGAGYHPAFVPALHHLLNAQVSGTESKSAYAMHPCWAERDRELSRAYSAAGLEFERLWPEPYASPGGNPPTVVYPEAATIRKTDSKDWEVELPMRCQNLAGAVEVVLRVSSASRTVLSAKRSLGESNPDLELRQLTGCTSTRTEITFSVATRGEPGTQRADVYVLDASGAVLARAEVPKFPH